VTFLISAKLKLLVQLGRARDRDTHMHNKIMRLTKLITVVLRIANKEKLNQIKEEQIMQPDFRSFWNYGQFFKI